MDSIIITPKSEQEYSFVMEMLKKMRIKAVPVQNKTTERIAGLPYTKEERIASIRRAEADYAAGHFKTSDELKAKHPRV